MPKSIKLPKQFYHWCKQHHIDLVHKKRSNMHFLRGFNRYFRINALDEFQVMQLEDDGNIRAMLITHTFPLPKTKQEFEKILTEVLKA